MDFKTGIFSSSTVCLIIRIWMFQLTTIHGKVPKDQYNEGTRSSQRVEPSPAGPVYPDHILINVSDSFNCEELSTIRLGLRYLNCITCLYFTTNPMDEGASSFIASRTINIERYLPDQQKSEPTGYAVHIDDITIHTVVREIVRELNVMKNYSDSAIDENANCTDAESANTNSIDAEFENTNSTDAESENTNSTDAKSENANSTDAESMWTDPSQIYTETYAHLNRFKIDAYASLAEQTFGNGSGLSTSDKLSSTDIDMFNMGYCRQITAPIMTQEPSCTVVFAIANESIGAEITRTNEWYQRYMKDEQFQDDCEPCGLSVPCNCVLPQFSSVEDCRNASPFQYTYRMPRYQCVEGECQTCDADADLADACEESTTLYYDENQCAEFCRLYQCSFTSNVKCVVFGSDNSTGAPPLPSFYSFDHCKSASVYDCGYQAIYQCIDGNCRACGASEGVELCEYGVTGYNGLENCIAESECKS